MVKKPQNAIYRNSGYGPTFGGGFDINIANNANSNTGSYTYFGNSYSVPSGVQSGNTILAGTYSFTPDEVEIALNGVVVASLVPNWKEHDFVAEFAARE
ncbi:hypothetical protein ACROYT_G030677 [Oculina patagonica]